MRQEQFLFLLLQHRECAERACNLNTFGLFQLSDRSRRRKRKPIHPSLSSTPRIKGRKHTLPLSVISIPVIRHRDKIAIRLSSLFVNILAPAFFNIVAVFCLFFSLPCACLFDQRNTLRALIKPLRQIYSCYQYCSPCNL